MTLEILYDRILCGVQVCLKICLKIKMTFNE